MNFFPSVTEEEIAAVKALTRSERDDLANSINSTDPFSLFKRNDAASDEIICPLCGNGEGESHSGVKPTSTNNGWLYGCRRPTAGGDCNFNGLLTTVIAKEENLDNRDFGNFCRILAIGAKFCNISVSKSGLDEARRRQSPKKEAGDKKESKDYSRWYIHARKNLPAFIKECGDKWRGFTLQELRAFGVGFVDNDTGRRILIPYSSHHCFARAVDKNTRQPKKHYGSKTLEVFNFSAVDIEHVIFVVEGEIDAMSIAVASKDMIHVVATGGAGEYEQLIARLNQKYGSAEVKPRFAVIFDNDDKGAGNVGQCKAAEAVAALMNNGYPASNYVLSETPNFDANDWFIKDRAGLAARMKELEEKAKTDLEAAAQELKKRVVVEEEKVQSHVDATLQDDTCTEKGLAFIKSAAARNDFIKLRNSPETPARNKAMIQLIRKWLEWSLTKTGQPSKIKATAANYRAIFSNDPALKGLFGYDSFHGETVFLRQAPWLKEKCVGLPWTDDDDAQLRFYLRENYAEVSHRELTPDAVRIFAQANRFNTVQNWLNNLPAWDGKPRAEKIFIDFLRVIDDEEGYAREVTMKFLFGALARIFYPGCNYPYTLILQGKQGCGKSYILERLGRKWHFSLQDKIGSEKSIDAIQNGWICEIGELSAGRKSEVNEVKNFLSTTHDVHRFPYERRATRRPRHVVFVGTCNDETPLNDPTGARRFLILKCGNRMNEFVEGLTDGYIQQIWAEALFKFRQMFPNDESFDANKLLLSPTSIEIATRLAEGATADDGIEGEIRAFLDKPIPAAPIWRLLTRNERGKFIAESHLVIGADELKNRQATRRRPKEAAELFELLEGINQQEVKDIRGNVIEYVYKLYGNTHREHICASEILSEMTNRPDRRLSSRRVNEALSLLDGWQKGERLRNDAEYGDQRNVYYRTTPLEFPEDDSDPPPNEVIGEENDDTNLDVDLPFGESSDTGGDTSNDFDNPSDNGNGDNHDTDIDTGEPANDSGNDTGKNPVIEEESEFEDFDPNRNYNDIKFGSVEEALIQCKGHYWQIKNGNDTDFNRKWLDYWKAKLEERRANTASA